MVYGSGFRGQGLGSSTERSTLTRHITPAITYASATYFLGSSRPSLEDFLLLFLLGLSDVKEVFAVRVLPIEP